MSDKPSWVKPFVANLTKLADPKNPDRAVLAHLRRGISGTPDQVLGRVGWLFNIVPDKHPNSLDAALLSAGLFAWVKGRCEHIEKINFGQAFGAGLSDEDKKQREKRFTALLDTHANELPEVLRHAISLIEGQPLDWEQLIRDLNSWGHPDRFVQKNWARGFWWNPIAEKEEKTADATTN